METLVTTVLPFISPAALPLVIVVVACFYIYKKIDNDRQKTKVERDADSQDLHDKFLKMEFDVANMKGEVGHHKDVLEDLRNQVNLLNINIVKLTVSLESLVNNLEKK